MGSDFENILNKLLLLKIENKDNHNSQWIHRTIGLTQYLIDLFLYVCDEYVIDKNINHFAILLSLSTIHQIAQTSSLNKKHISKIENFLPSYSFKRSFNDTHNDIGKEQWHYIMRFTEVVVLDNYSIDSNFNNPYLGLDERKEQMNLNQKMIKEELLKQTKIKI